MTNRAGAPEYCQIHGPCGSRAGLKEPRNRSRATDVQHHLPPVPGGRRRNDSLGRGMTSRYGVDITALGIVATLVLALHGCCTSSVSVGRGSLGMSIDDGGLGSDTRHEHYRGEVILTGVSVGPDTVTDFRIIRELATRSDASLGSNRLDRCIDLGAPRVARSEAVGDKVLVRRLTLRGHLEAAPHAAFRTPMGYPHCCVR